MVRPTVARIDLAALKSNYQHIVDALGRDRPDRVPGVIAVVKANAYGHGAGEVARALEDAGADLLACADIEEGAALRAAGVRAEILVFGALSVSDLDGLFDCRLTPTISTPGAARAVQAAAARYGQRVRYHLKIDTGMNRLGFRFDNLRRTLPELLASENLELDAVYTHFATADDVSSDLFDRQRARFDAALSDIETLGARPRYRHAANSAALLRDPRVWYDRVRPGLLLYGIVPPPLTSAIELTPVMTLGSRVVAVKGLRPGEVSGYGARFTAARADDHRHRAGGIRRWARSAARWPRGRPDPRPPLADHRLGLHGHAHRRCDRNGRLARRRGRDRRSPGPRSDRCSRDGGDDRIDSVGNRVPHRLTDRTGLRS